MSSKPYRDILGLAHAALSKPKSSPPGVEFIDEMAPSLLIDILATLDAERAKREAMGKRNKAALNRVQARAEASEADNARLRGLLVETAPYIEMRTKAVEATNQGRAYMTRDLSTRIAAALAETPTPAACLTCGSLFPKLRGYTPPLGTKDGDPVHHMNLCPDPFHTPPAEAECGCNDEPEWQGTGDHAPDCPVWDQEAEDAALDALLRLLGEGDEPGQEPGGV